MRLLDDVPLTEDEAQYVDAARAANTVRGYRSDWQESSPAGVATTDMNHCRPHRQPLPAT